MLFMCNKYIVFLEHFVSLHKARAALLTGRLPIRNGFYTTNGHARNGKNSYSWNKKKQT